MPDVDVRVFNERAMNRISRVVRFIESSGFEEGGDPFLGRATAGQVTALVDADIEHHEIGLCKRATGADFAAVVAPGLDIDGVFNPMLKVWEGSRVLLKRGVLAGALAGEGNRWVIAQAFSATRIRGQLTADIAPGGSATMSSITPINGTFNPASTTVFMPASGTALSLGDYAYADLVWTGVNSEWQLDNRAPGSGGGGPAVRNIHSVNFSSIPPVTPDTAVFPAEEAIIDFTNSNQDGTVTGVSWDGVDTWTIAAGTYEVYFLALVDTTVGSPADTINAACSVQWREVGGGFPVPLYEQGGRATVHRTDRAFAQGATDVHRLTVPGPSPLAIQLVLTHASNSTGDPDGNVRVFHAKVHIEKIS